MTGQNLTRGLILLTAAILYVKDGDQHLARAVRERDAVERAVRLFNLVFELEPLNGFLDDAIRRAGEARAQKLYDGRPGLETPKAGP